MCRTCGTYNITAMLGVILLQKPRKPHYDLSAATRISSDRGQIIELATDNLDAIRTAFPMPGPLDKRRLLIEYVARRAPGLGKVAQLDASDDYPVIFGEGSAEFSYLLKHLIDTGLIETRDQGGVRSYGLSIDGWREHAQYNEATRPKSPAPPSTALGWQALAWQTPTRASRKPRAPQRTRMKRRTLGDLFDSDYVRKQLARMHSNIDTDPDLAIGTAKEFLETICKTILADQGITHDSAEKLPRLVKRAVEQIELVPPSRGDQGERELLERLLKQAGGIAHTVAELRNKVGTGHGRQASHHGLYPQHAQLIVNITSAVGDFVAKAPRKPKPTP